MCLFCRSQRKIFWRMRETEQFWAPLTSIVFIFLLEVNGAPKQPGYKLSSEYLPLCSEQRQVWNYMRVSKWWQNFQFWVNYPFNYIKTFEQTAIFTCIYVLLKYSQRNVDFWFHKSLNQSSESLRIIVNYCDVFISCLDSFWRHPFTAEDPLVNQWCNATFLQICSDEDTNSFISWMTWV